ncbi:YciI family protein [Thalassobellus suaedae]|uniref:YciI family protein n=1 Tax=Thalassobellus suaedae TaxID=3074124 RepID=A0ABY9XQB6_9FLAO|nr:YciI family protein [Flavobacteriaceae bacterium HL-DH14]
MYIINVTYKVSLDIIDKYINEHIEYLDEQYTLGNFIASGRKVPRTGGVILSNLSNENELLDIIEKDPFKVRDLAVYEFTEFIPSKTSEALKFLID